jgi:DNA-3-methyladenine glycosylase I
VARRTTVRGAVGAGVETGVGMDDGPVGLVLGPDGRRRCWWADGHPAMVRYHDTEWGCGARDEQALFERLALEAFQAGLSWRTVLLRRDRLREAFADFSPEAVARFDAAHVERLLADPGLIRNRAKITAVVHNAQVLLDLHTAGTGLGDITAEACAAHPGPAARPVRRADVPASSPASTALSARLRALGWRFVGPTTAYAYLQASGWVDDHLAGCHAPLG